MVRTLLLVSILACSGVAGASPPIEPTKTLDGRWSGAVAFRGRSNPMVFDFYVRAEHWSGFSGPPDAPDAATALLNVRYDAPRLSFTLADGPARIEFEGTVADDAIKATAHAGEQEMMLELKRAGDAPPPPFWEEPIEFSNGDTTLGANLLLPPGAGPHPAIVLIHGTGRQTRDEWRFFGALFARAGIAALLYDKRDVGHDPSGMDLVSLEELAGDALASVAALKARDDIRDDRIGLWGISQGGWVEPIAAAQSTDIAFIVAVSGPGVSYAELSLFAIEHRLRARGFNDADVAEALTALRRLDEFVRTGKDSIGIEAMLAEAQRDPWFEPSTLTRSLPTETERKTWLRWRNLDLDPCSYWERVHVPVLLLYGERDDIVPVGPSVERITAALAKAGNTRLTVNVFPGATHDLVLAPADGANADAPPRYAPGYFELLTRWAREQTDRAR